MRTHAQAKFEQVARGAAAAEPAADADAAARAAFGLGESLQARTTRSTGFELGVIRRVGLMHRDAMYSTPVGFKFMKQSKVYLGGRRHGSGRGTA